MKKDNFKKGTQFRKVLSKENISTSSFKIHFDFMLMRSKTYDLLTLLFLFPFTV